MSILSVPMTFFRGVLGTGPWALWVGLMVVVNGVVPLFFLPSLEAVVTLGVFAVAGAGMMTLTWWFGFTRILGAGHWPWLISVPWLATRIGSAEGAMAWWLIGLVAVNDLSLVLDANDVRGWLGGEREPGT
ncbi:MAG: hypothetical protein GY913_12870 [Proteobacteria bacterium]|nr:hypothetical protein [Pseudomonadota bacterium]MCP4917799.1 hypothetical protein [Pseudomonadota bacterium]